MGGDEVVEEGHSLEAALAIIEAGGDGAAEQQTAEAVEAAAGTTGSKTGIFGDYGSFEKI